jgi:hypothetical protein
MLAPGDAQKTHQPMRNKNASHVSLRPAVACADALRTHLENDPKRSCSTKD